MVSSYILPMSVFCVWYRFYFKRLILIKVFETMPHSVSQAGLSLLSAGMKTLPGSGPDFEVCLTRPWGGKMSCGGGSLKKAGERKGRDKRKMGGGGPA